MYIYIYIYITYIYYLFQQIIATYGAYYQEILPIIERIIFTESFLLGVRFNFCKHRQLFKLSL